MRRAVGAVVVVVLAPMLLACGGHTLTGTLDLISSDGVQVSGSSCSGKGGYDDLSQGASVTLKDEGGKLISTTTLGAGKPTSTGVRCTWTFTFENVPDASFYKIEVSHRGELDYSRSDLDKLGWKVSATIGS